MNLLSQAYDLSKVLGDFHSMECSRKERIWIASANAQDMGKSYIVSYWLSGWFDLGRNTQMTAPGRSHILREHQLETSTNTSASDAV